MGTLVDHSSRGSLCPPENLPKIVCAPDFIIQTVLLNQLAHFHPDYMFAGEDSGDAANFTNRSPWPMLHLLREVDIEQAIAHYEDVNRIPARNIERARQLGREYFATILAKIRTEK